MSEEHQLAMRLQETARGHVEKLAVEVARQPGQRDPEAIMAAWGAVDSMRSRLNSVYRTVRKTENVPRHTKNRKEYDIIRGQVREARVLGKRLRMWEEMQALVERHLDPVATDLDLFPPVTEADNVLAVVSQALFAMANPNQQSDDADDYGAFADIPLPTFEFRNLMHVCYRLLLAQGRAHDAKFLDVGCGGGSKVLIANYYFPEAHGLEYDDAYAAAAERFFEVTKSEHCHAIHGNGITFEDYADYDVIYFYRPMKRHEGLLELERQIFETAKPGALIAATYNTFLEPRQGLEGANIIGPVFLAHGTQEEADALREDARFTATDIVRRARDHKFDPGFWAPLINVASFGGSV